MFDVSTTDADTEALSPENRAAFMAAKVGLIVSLGHDFETCSGGIAPYCFACEGLRAVMERLGQMELQ